jgi:hypothetical protein
MPIVATPTTWGDSMRKLMAVVLLGTLGALLMPLPAVADQPGPWAPFEATSFTLEAGTRCPFTLQGDVVSDQERIRTLETYPDGSPRIQEVVGQLVSRFTNVETGESVVRNLTGTAIVEYGTDGSFTLTLQGGHFAVGLAPTDAGGPAFLIMTGSGYAVTFDPDGTRHLTFGNGTVENICETLA